MTTEKHLQLGGDVLPLLSGDPDSSCEHFILENVDYLQELYKKYGLILFRNFADSDPEFLNRIAKTLVGEPMRQEGRHTKRTNFGGSIYTSTEHSKKASIVLHSENSYMPSYPRSMLFYCALPSKEGGITPLANLHAVTAVVSEETKQKVRQTGITYVRRIGVLPGQDWREVYSGYDQSDLTRHLEESGTTVHWQGNVLTTTRTLPGFIHDRDQQNDVWFNALYSSNSLTIPKVQREFLIREFGEDNLPNDTFFGSGERLSSDEFSQLENAYNSNRVSFEWEKGDLLWLNNERFAHGRDPFKGERVVYVVLGNAVNWQPIN